MHQGEVKTTMPVVGRSITIIGVEHRTGRAVVVVDGKKLAPLVSRFRLTGRVVCREDGRSVLVLYLRGRR